MRTLCLLLLSISYGFAGYIVPIGPVLNVRAFGATGDGVTDDSAAVNNALGNAVGARVYFPTGTYLCNNLSSTNSNNQIMGDGGASVIKHKDTTAPNRMLIISGTNTLVTGLVFDNSNGNTSSTGLNLNADSQRVRDCQFILPNSGGVRVLATATSREDILIEGCFFNGGGFGVATKTGDTNMVKKVRILNNYFIGGTNGNAIDIDMPNGLASDVAVIGNVIRDYTFASGGGSGMGIAFAQVIGGTIANNIVEHCANAGGIHCEAGSANITISGNVVTNCQNQGIVIFHGIAACTDIVITGNTVANCSQAGLDGIAGIEGAGSGTTGARIKIIGNTVRSTGIAASSHCYGIAFSGTVVDSQIENNSVYGTLGTNNAGISIAAATNVRIAGNRSTGQKYGFKAGGAVTDVQVSGNDFSGNSTNSYDATTIGVATRYYGLFDGGDVPANVGGGIGSLSTIAAASIATTGWTNTMGVNAQVFMTGTGITYTLYNNAGTSMYTNAATVTQAIFVLQPGGKFIVTAGSAVAGKAIPW